MLAWLLVTLTSSVARAQPGSPPAPPIERLHDDLFVARYDRRATMFLVTSEGVVVCDPISVRAAEWLRDELSTRFPGRPVRYVLHTHHHFDRASGAAVFADATSVGRVEFNRELRKVKNLSAYADVLPTKRQQGGRERITLGGRSAELVPVGRGHAADMSVVYFPDARTVFAVDHPDLGQVPLTFGPFTPYEVAEWLGAISDLDFDTLVSGDGERFDASAVRALKPYVQALVEAVESGARANRTLRELEAEILLPELSDSPHHAARLTHIRAAYASLSIREWSVFGSVGANASLRNQAYCDTFDRCSRPRALVPAGSVGARYAFGRFSAVGEFGAGWQATASRAGQARLDVVNMRRSYLSGLLGFRPADGRSMVFDVLGGVTLFTSDTRGFARRRDTIVPAAGPVPFATRDMGVGVTSGATMTFSSGLWNVLLPVRLSYVVWGASDYRPAPLDVRVGIALSRQLARRVSRTPGRTPPISLPAPRP